MSGVSDMHRIRISLFALLLSASVIAPATANGIDEQYAMTMPTPSPYQVAYHGMFAEAVPQAKMTPMLLAFEADGTDFNKSVIADVGTCSSMQDQRCKDAEYIQYDALLPQCSAKVSVDCIEGLIANDESGKPLNVTIVDRFEVPGFDFTASPALQLPTGREGVLFKVEGVTHPGGEMFLAYANVAGQKLSTEKTFSTVSFRARIGAVKLVNKAGDPPMAETRPSFYVGSRLGARNGYGQYEDCVLLTQSTCAQSFPLPMDTSFGMSLRLSSPISGWLHGRFSEPVASVSIANGVQRISMQAKPVRVPSALGWIKNTDLPDDLKAFYASLDFVGGQGYGCVLEDQSQCVGVKTWRSVLRSLQADELSMREFTLWLKHLGDKAVAVPTIWQMQSTDRGNGPNAQCYDGADKLSGIVMTNATSYIAGPPTFNTQTQTLDYKVAAPHFLPDGTTPFLGTYDLLMRSDVARCVYKFSSAPISATVSVVSENGQNQVATTVVNEKDGWLTLRAAGFGFSSPTVRVQLTQSAPIAPKPVAKKSTITCVKGKTTKKISAINPKCPVGFRKK